MKGVDLTPLRRIPVANGDILHVMRASDEGFAGFGEAYVSMVHNGREKGWTKHRKMVLNFVVLHGAVRFLIRDEADPRECRSVELSAGEPEKYRRLTVQPGLWVAFQGLADPTSIVLNIASIAHDPVESDKLPIDAFLTACSSVLR